jgi:hypothetical protein
MQPFPSEDDTGLVKHLKKKGWVQSYIIASQIQSTWVQQVFWVFHLWERSHLSRNNSLPSWNIKLISIVSDVTKDSKVLVGIERLSCDLFRSGLPPRLKRSLIRGYTSAPAHTTYPIYPDGTKDLSINLRFVHGVCGNPKVFNRKGEIILSATAIVLYPISELIEMDMSLHMIQI